MDALTAVCIYLPVNICPTQPPLPPPRVTSLYEADTPAVPHGMHRLPFSPTVAGLVADLQDYLTRVIRQWPLLSPSNTRMRDKEDPMRYNTMDYSTYANKVLIQVVDRVTLLFRAALVQHALCEPDAPIHDLVLRRDNTDGAGVIITDQIVINRHTGVSLYSVVLTTRIVRLIKVVN